jgi:hypothetical protein
MASAIAEAKNNNAHKFYVKPYKHANIMSLSVLQQIHNGRSQSPQYRYGDHYRAYKKKHHGNNHDDNKYPHNKNHPNKYHYPPHDKKKQHHNNNGYSYRGLNNRQHYKPLRQYRLHSGFKTNYWSAHKRHGYQHKRVARHHYYYNKRGFYFPGLGAIAHGHQHNDNCDDWHFSALLASSILLSIYNK